LRVAKAGAVSSGIAVGQTFEGRRRTAAEGPGQ
jgi:hypothetical protein